MIKAIQALLAGMFFTLILDFFLFLGIYLHYIRPHEIGIYYNVLFADHQSLLLFLVSSVILGAITIYSKQGKYPAIILATLFAIVLLALIPPLGNSVGEALLLKPNQTFYDKRYRYQGDLYYDGRDTIWLYDNELQRIIKLNKQELNP